MSSAVTARLPGTHSRLGTLTAADFTGNCMGLSVNTNGEVFMRMLNPHCGVDCDPRGVARLTICGAGPLNILGSAAIRDVREGLDALASDRQIRALILAGESQKSMIGGADIKEMATLDQAAAEKFITGLRDLCEAVRRFPAPVIARLPGWCLGGG